MNLPDVVAKPACRIRAIAKLSRDTVLGVEDVSNVDGEVLPRLVVREGFLLDGSS